MSLTDLTPYGRGAVALAADVVAGASAVVAAAVREVDVVDGVAPSGRGAVALEADVVAGPPAVVAAAAFEAHVVDNPHPLWERRRGAGI